MVRAWSASSLRATSDSRVGAEADAGEPTRPRRPARASSSVAYTDGRADGDAEHALEAGAGVDVLALEVGLSAPSAPPEVLREHQVPELDVALLGRRVGRAAVGAELGAEVPEQLGATGRTGRCRPSPRSCPCRGAGCARSGSRPRRPRSRLGLVVVDVAGDPDAVAVEAEHLGEELPRPRDGVGLEVVAEAEVAQHLEEAEVARRAADGVEVVVLAAGPHARLDRRGPRRLVRHLLLAEEVRDERHHPRVGEHRAPTGAGGISPRRGHGGVLLGDPEVGPGLSQLLCLHRSSPPLVTGRVVGPTLLVAPNPPPSSGRARGRRVTAVVVDPPYRCPPHRRAPMRRARGRADVGPPGPRPGG